MKLTQTQNGKIIVVRRTRNGAYERIGTLNTNMSLKEAKAAFHTQLEDMECFYNGKANARQHLREAVRNFNLETVAGSVNGS